MESYKDEEELVVKVVSPFSHSEDSKGESWKEGREYEGDEMDTLLKTPSKEEDRIEISKQPRFHEEKVGLFEKCCKGLYRKRCLTNREIQYFMKFKATCVHYDEEDSKHEEYLRDLWSLAFPEEAVPANLKSPKWKALGFQSFNPRTDFRGGGIVSLHSLRYLLKMYNETFLKMRASALDIFLLAITSINITYFLLEFFHLTEDRHPSRRSVCKRYQFKNFARLNAHSKQSFYELNCLGLIYLYHLQKKFWNSGQTVAFNVLIERTKRFIGRLMSHEIHNLTELKTRAIFYMNRDTLMVGRE